jgi:hypothetical protein
MLPSETVRAALLEVWGRQACQHPEDWPRVLNALMHDGGGPDVNKRHSLAPAVDFAVERLLALFAADVPTDAARAVHRAFYKLDRPHAEELARLLIAAREAAT